MLKKLDEYRFVVEKEKSAGMNIEGLIYADRRLIDQIAGDKTIEQVANVATLPGLVGRSLAMPDAHQGYGFPIGGVAASDLEHGIVSAGGVGFDINCGLRMLTTGLSREEVLPHLESLLDGMVKRIPRGAGGHSKLRLSADAMDGVLRGGAEWIVGEGYGTVEDLDHIEERGNVPYADPAAVGEHARERGHEQLGTLGSGNHFVEIQYVDEIFDREAAEAFGLQIGQTAVLIHTGSRGLGHQVCTDYLDLMQEASRKYKIRLVDRQLACAPIPSGEGQAYLRAMAASANFAFANRQVITHWIRETFADVLGAASLRLLYDVAHNIAKIEEHTIGDTLQRVLVHRKGATRAFPKGHPDVPADYRAIGQPVLIPGSMGTSSYVLVGTERAMAETFGSTCHGAGRAKSRTAAMKDMKIEQLMKQLKERNIIVRGLSKSGLLEEHPGAYKDVDRVVEVVHHAGIARKVARLVPMGVMKG